MNNNKKIYNYTSCEHSTRKTRCIKCSGGSICQHKKRRVNCQICNINGYIILKHRSLINYYLKKNNINKIHKTNEYIGCNIEEFKNHIEKQFKENMDWNNYGILWNLDHIIPLSYNFPSIEDVIKRMHYTNIQPMICDKNFSKGKNII